MADLNAQTIACTECRTELNNETLRRSLEHRDKLEDLLNEVVPALAKPVASTKPTFLKKATIGKTEELKAEYTVTKPIKGLTNFGNTCYFNAAMQCLLATKALLSTQSQSGTLHRHFKEFASGVETTKGPVHSSNSLLKAVQGKSGKFTAHQQQDAHEFLVAFFGRLVDEELAGRKGERTELFESAVMRCVGSYLVNKGTLAVIVVHCMGCGGDNWVFDPCTIYSLPMESVARTANCRGKKVESAIAKEEIKEMVETESGKEKYTCVDINGKSYMEPLKKLVASDGQLTSLKDYLGLFFGKEILSSAKGNAFDCSNCKKAKPKAVREYFIYKPPRVFIVQLKRFLGARLTLRKNAKRIAVPPILTLDDFTLLDALSSEDSSESASFARHQYELYALISHSGGMNGGHYVAYVKAKNGRWYYASDSHVNEVSEKRVLEAEAYVIFYRSLSP